MGIDGEGRATFLKRKLEQRREDRTGDNLGKYRRINKYSSIVTLVLVASLLLPLSLPLAHAYTTSNGQLNATVYNTYEAITTSNGQLNISIEVSQMGYYTSQSVNATISIFKWDTIVTTTSTSTTTTSTTTILDAGVQRADGNNFFPEFARWPVLGKRLIEYIND